MQIAGTKICSYCAKAIPRNAVICIECGRDLEADLYAVVPDGLTYGIALEGEIRIHGLQLRRAQEIASILNSVERQQIA